MCTYLPVCLCGCVCVFLLVCVCVCMSIYIIIRITVDSAGCYTKYIVIPQYCLCTVVITVDFSIPRYRDTMVFSKVWPVF